MSSPAARKRAYRKRMRDGRICLKLEVCEFALAAAMLAANRLTERQALDRAALQQAANDILAEWISSWTAC